MNTISDLVSDYQVWLKDKTVLTALRDWTKITTPYVDRHNDYLEIYVKESSGGFELSDDGHTLQDLEMSGCKLDTPHRRELFEVTLNGFGVRVEKGALTLRSSRQNFPLKKHSLVQAMLAVNDLFYLAQSSIRNVFFEDVQSWLDEIDARYVPHIQFAGVSGFTHVFDFAIPKSKSAPERLLKAVNNPSRDKAQSLAFAWHDTRESRQGNGVAYAILNDSGKFVSDTIVDALNAYDIRPIKWSDRAQERAMLGS